MSRPTHRGGRTAAPRLGRAHASDIVRSLAEQDAAMGDTDPPAEQLARWRQSGRECGDHALVTAIDLLGTDAEAIYARARGRA